MGRYMTVILKEKYKNDSFIKELNEEQHRQYGANTYPKFNPWYELEEEPLYEFVSALKNQNK